MSKEEQVKWQESNVALIGTQDDLEQRIKAAKTEKEWEGAGTKVGIQIWRIEQFQVKPWPIERYGEFYQGDSYIILHTYKSNKDKDKLSWNIHFWIGKESTQDEYGTAAYKTVELDDLLGGTPVEYREVQGHESPAFVSLFQKITILSGGIDSGFNFLEPEKFRPRLLQVKGERTTIMEVPMKGSSLNAVDCFILDNGTEVFLYQGQQAQEKEITKAKFYCDELVLKRREKEKATVKLHSFLSHKESQTEEWNSFWKSLGGRVDVVYDESKDDEYKQGAYLLYQLSETDGKFDFKKVSQATNTSLKDRLMYNDFKSDDVFIADCSDIIFCWIGKKCSSLEKKKGFSFAVDYIKKNNKPSHIPLAKVLEGYEDSTFWSRISK